MYYANTSCTLAAAYAPKNQVELAILFWKTHKLSKDMLAAAKALKHHLDWSSMIGRCQQIKRDPLSKGKGL